MKAFTRLPLVLDVKSRERVDRRCRHRPRPGHAAPDDAGAGGRRAGLAHGRARARRSAPGAGVAARAAVRRGRRVADRRRRGPLHVRRRAVCAGSSFRTSHPSCAAATAKSSPPNGASCPAWCPPNTSAAISTCTARGATGATPIADMVSASRQLGYEYIAITDHSERAWSSRTLAAADIAQTARGDRRASRQGPRHRDSSRRRSRHHARRQARLRRRSARATSTSCSRRCTTPAATTMRG